MSKLNAAESIRGLACIAVVFSHLSLTFYPYLHHFTAEDQASGLWDAFLHHSPFAFLYSGTAAVFVFFVLSGYVLSYAVLSKQNVLNKVAQMTVKRYPRLAIPALLSCVVCWFLLSFIHIPTDFVNGWYQSYATQSITLKQALYEGSIGSFFFAESSSNWVLWTMQLELFGSLLLFFLYVVRHFNICAFHLLALVLPMLVWRFNTEAFFLGISSFVIGLYIYLYAKKLSNLTAFLLLLVGLYLAGAHNDSYSYAWLYKILGWRTYEYGNFFAGIFIVYSILQNDVLGRWLDQKILVYLGKLSFSIYLLHMVMIYLICVPVFNVMMSFFNAYDVAVTTSVSVFWIVLLGVSSFYSRYVDELAIKVGQRLAQRL